MGLLQGRTKRQRGGPTFYEDGETRPSDQYETRASSEAKQPTGLRDSIYPPGDLRYILPDHLLAQAQAVEATYSARKSLPRGLESTDIPGFSGSRESTTDWSRIRMGHRNEVVITECEDYGEPIDS